MTRFLNKQKFSSKALCEEVKPYGNISFPVGYELIHKEVEFCDLETKQVKRKASVTKNEHFRSLMDRCIKNNVIFSKVSCIAGATFLLSL